jgi:hypothetical protein
LLNCWPTQNFSFASLEVPLNNGKEMKIKSQSAESMMKCEGREDIHAWENSINLKDKKKKKQARQGKLRVQTSLKL